MSKGKSIQDAIHETLQYIKGRKEGTIKSYRTKYPKLNKAMIDGFELNSTITLGGRPSVGKCLGKGTKILMFDGSLKKVEDIRVGDLLMGIDSSPRKVLSTTSGVDKMYKVDQLRGITYKVNSSHILSLKRGKTEKRQTYGTVRNIEVSQYMNLPEGTKSRWKGYMSPIEFEETELVVDPYLIGLWIGDGTSCKPSITTADYEVVNYMEHFCVKNDLKLRKEGKYTYHITTGTLFGDKKRNIFNNILRDESLLCNKHIPKKYIINSRRNRLSFLAGIIDSDGYVSDGSTIEITLKQKEIIKDISFICNTLGFRTSINKKIGSFTREDGTTFIGSYYRIIISGNLSCIPLKIGRKLLKLRNNSRNSLMTRIKVTEDGYGEYFGFEIDGDRLFLLEDCTVTHNSAVSDCFVESVLSENIDKDGNPEIDLMDFNWELSSRVMLIRRISAALKKTYKYVLSADNNKISDRELQEIEELLINKYAHLPITFYEEPSTSAGFARTVKEQVEKTGRPTLVRVDHTLLTKQAASEASQVQMLLNLLMEANAIKKRYPVIFLFLTQINREFEERQEDGSDKAFPRQGDVYGGDAAAMFSETIILLNKPAKYGIVQYGRRGNGIPPIEDNDLYMHIVKNRNSDPDLILHYKENFKNMSITEY